jgi:hypothetical protein
VNRRQFLTAAAAAPIVCFVPFLNVQDVALFNDIEQIPLLNEPWLRGTYRGWPAPGCPSR